MTKGYAENKLVILRMICGEEVENAAKFWGRNGYKNDRQQYGNYVTRTLPLLAAQLNR